MDLLGHYRTRETGTAYGDSSICLTGATVDGVDLAGCDAIRTVPKSPCNQKAKARRPRRAGADTRAAIRCSEGGPLHWLATLLPPGRRAEGSRPARRDVAPRRDGRRGVRTDSRALYALAIAATPALAAYHLAGWLPPLRAADALFALAGVVLGALRRRPRDRPSCTGPATPGATSARAGSAPA